MLALLLIAMKIGATVVALIALLTAFVIIWRKCPPKGAVMPGLVVVGLLCSVSSAHHVNEGNHINQDYPWVHPHPRSTPHDVPHKQPKPVRPGPQGEPIRNPPAPEQPVKPHILPAWVPVPGTPYVLPIPIPFWY